MKPKSGSSPVFEADLARFWSTRPFLSESSPLLLGVSGGPDSLALLHWMTHSGVCSPHQLHVVHVDHGLRPTSAKEAAFVGRLCAAWQIPCHTVKGEVARHLTQSGGSQEAVARQIRYRLLGETAVDLGASYVLVAHHADDQAETILMRLLRGSGLNGLGSMRPVSPWPDPAFPQLRLVRPLLYTGRHDIEDYCRRHELEPLIDESNLDLRFTRNRIRHELIPFLETYNPQIRKQLAQTADLLTADADLLARVFDQSWEETFLAGGSTWVRGSLPVWRSLPLSAQRAVVRRMVAQAVGGLSDISFEQVEHLCAVLRDGETGQTADAGTGCRFFIYYDFFIATAGRPDEAFDLPQVTTADPLPLSTGETISLNPGWQISVQQGRLPAETWRVSLDLPPGKSLFLRGRRPGDRLAPAGMNGQTVKLKELMIDRKIPAPLRDRWPLITDGEQVLWVAGHRLSSAAAEEGWHGPMVTITISKVE